MRQLLTILALFGYLATPVVSASEDPFDFSSPLPGTSTKGRAAQYFSRSLMTDEKTDLQQSVQATESLSLPEQQRSSLPAQRPKNYAADLFGKADAGITDERPPTVSFSREMARERKPVAPSTPQDTLRRFDDFLKTRDVVPAEYTAPAAGRERSAIRPVQASGTESPFDDLPSLGDLDAQPQQRPIAEPAPPQTPVMEMQPAGNGQPQAHVRPRRDRLTDPISVDTLPAQSPAELPTPLPVVEETPFVASPAPNRSRQETPAPAVRKIPQAVAEYSRTPLPSIAESVPGQDAGSTVETSWTLLNPLNLGQECTAELSVRNSGEAVAQRVSLEVRVPESVRVIKATPAPVEQQAFLGWKFAELGAGETTTIQITFVAAEAGPLEMSSHVRHTSSQNESFTVSRPRLELTVSGPEEVRVGEPASQIVLVKNPGTGVATNVKVQAVIPAGLEHAEGGHLLTDIGSLNPGEVRSVRLPMMAVSGGDHILQVQANADSGLVKTAAAEVTVIAPSLKAGLNGPPLRYVGREAEFTIRVLNDGMAATDFVQVTHQVPEGFDFVSAERGVKFDSATRLINWYVGPLESNESQDLKIRLVARQIGEFVHDVRVTSDQGAEAKAKLATRIEGAASLVLKVADLEDPVEVGSETAYEIIITNEGTAAAHQVGLTCEIPQGLSLMNAQGPSEHRAQAEMIGFRPIDDLPAGESLTYRVHVKGESAGDRRFRCRLTSESLSQPLFTEELTKFYGE